MLLAKFMGQKLPHLFNKAFFIAAIGKVKAVKGDNALAIAFQDLVSGVVQQAKDVFRHAERN